MTRIADSKLRTPGGKCAIDKRARLAKMHSGSSGVKNRSRVRSEDADDSDVILNFDGGSMSRRENDAPIRYANRTNAPIPDMRNFGPSRGDAHLYFEDPNDEMGQRIAEGFHAMYGLNSRERTLANIEYGKLEVKSTRARAASVADLRRADERERGIEGAERRLYGEYARKPKRISSGSGRKAARRLHRGK